MSSRAWLWLIPSALIWVAIGALGTILWESR